MWFRALINELVMKTRTLAVTAPCPYVVKKLKFLGNQKREIHPKQPMEPGNFRLPVSLFLCILVVVTSVLAYWNCGVYFGVRMEDALEKRAALIAEANSVSNTCFGQKEVVQAFTLIRYFRVETQLFDYFCVIDTVTILLLCWTAWNPRDGQVQNLWLYLHFMIILVISGYGISQFAWGSGDAYAKSVLIQYWLMLIAKLGTWIYVGRKFSDVLDLLSCIFSMLFGDNSCRSPDEGQHDGKVGVLDTDKHGPQVGAGNSG